MNQMENNKNNNNNSSNSLVFGRWPQTKTFLTDGHESEKLWKIKARLKCDVLATMTYGNVLEGVLLDYMACGIPS